MKMKAKHKPKSPLAVLMFLAMATSETDLLHPFHDSVAPRMLRWTDGPYIAGRLPRLHSGLRKSAERSDPGAYGFMLARAHCMDDVLRKEISAGIDQLVILGAGYDTRAYRMRDELQDVAVFEVDLPLVSEDKRVRVKKAIGEVPSDVAYVQVDFNREEWLTRLVEQGYDMAARTLVVLSGVSMYLPEQAVLGIMAQIGEHASNRTSIVFDYFFDDLTETPAKYYGGPEWIKRVTRYGEEPRYGMAFGAVGEVLQNQGLALKSHWHIEEIAKEYLCRRDGTLAARPYDFAALAHAVAGDAQGISHATERSRA